MKRSREDWRNLTQKDFGRLLLQALFVQVSSDKGFLWNRLDEAESVLKAFI